MIQNNANGGSGGGIYVSNQSDYNINVSIENSIFNNNTTALHVVVVYILMDKMNYIFIILRLLVILQLERAAELMSTDAI